MDGGEIAYVGWIGGRGRSVGAAGPADPLTCSLAGNRGRFARIDQWIIDSGDDDDAALRSRRHSGRRVALEPIATARQYAWPTKPRKGTVSVRLRPARAESHLGDKSR